MGSIERTPAGTWKARYRDPQGRSRRKTFKRKRDAEMFLASADVRYASIRDALINAVHSHHVDWLDADAGDRLLNIRNALLDYESVFTTSYDLLVYWAIMNAGTPPGDGFGDLFWNAGHTFDPFDTEPFGNKTLVYWLHGGLHLSARRRDTRRSAQVPARISWRRSPPATVCRCS